MTSPTRIILTLSCPDTAGIVAAVSQFLLEKGGFIEESTQFGDGATKQFFMRVCCSLPVQNNRLDGFNTQFNEAVGKRFKMQFHGRLAAHKPRVLILVSKQMHCLNDLMYRAHTGGLAIEIPAVISNHPDAQRLVGWHGINYHHCPIENGDKAAQEAKIMAVIEKEKIELVVLARYMQILSPEFCAKLKGRMINIHHSFLPSFKGAKPYHQAFARGVKIIGATAHYVTDDLDEGPIIEQEVSRVDHTQTPQSLAQIGHDIEALVLARAVKAHIEQRILLNGSKTVLFR
jgi:formyltetrahydrofolate deformylase